MIYIFQVRTHPQRKKIITFKVSQLLNKLPTQLKTSTSPNIFKYELKTYR